jgi:hypothetical protein
VIFAAPDRTTAVLELQENSKIMTVKDPMPPLPLRSTTTDQAVTTEPDNKVRTALPTIYFTKIINSRYFH